MPVTKSGEKVISSVSSRTLYHTSEISHTVPMTRKFEDVVLNMNTNRSNDEDEAHNITVFTLFLVEDLAIREGSMPRHIMVI